MYARWCDELRSDLGEMRRALGMYFWQIIQSDLFNLQYSETSEEKSGRECASSQFPRYRCLGFF